MGCSSAPLFQQLPYNVSIPMHIADVVAGLRLPGLVIMIIIIAIYFALGLFSLRWP